MTSFAKKTLSEPKRVSLLLKEAREAQGLSLGDVSTQTKINSRYLQAIEDSHFDSIPCAATYKKNFVKRYAAVLALNVEEIARQFSEEEAHRLETVTPTLKHLQTRSLPNMPSLIRYGLAIVAIIMCATYLGAQLGNLIAPPNLAIQSPENGLSTNKKTIDVTGTTNKEADIYINNELVTNRSDDMFRATLTLNPGTNTIVIRAEKKHGRKKSETLHIIYNETVSANQHL